MSADPNRYKLTAAKELMQADQYDAARGVLETIPNDPTARQWLTWMDQNVPQRKAKPRGGWGLMRVIPLVFACSCFSFVAGFGASRAPTTAGVLSPTHTVVAAAPTTNATVTALTVIVTSPPTDEPAEQ